MDQILASLGTSLNSVADIKTANLNDLGQLFTKLGEHKTQIDSKKVELETRLSTLNGDIITIQSEIKEKFNCSNLEELNTLIDQNKTGLESAFNELKNVIDGGEEKNSVESPAENVFEEQENNL